MDKSAKNLTIAISAINFSEGGPLTVLQDCLSSARNVLPEYAKIYAFVYDAKLLNVLNVNYIEIKSGKKSWLMRLYWEWFGFKKISKDLSFDFWLSLHDITPTVYSKQQAVYCHNPAPFYKPSLMEIFLEPKFYIFNKLYSYIYKINLNKNKYIIMQQEWIRREFALRYGVLNTIVAYPKVSSTQTKRNHKKGENFIFFYPALPRVFKNFQILGEAANIIRDRGVFNFQIVVTISGNENRYARWIFNRYRTNPNIKFAGRLNKTEMIEYYNTVDALVFPSLLETWGLPISEAKSHELPLLVSDLDYASESVGNYDLVTFFDAHDALDLADKMILMISNIWRPTTNTEKPHDGLFAPTWDKLWNILV